MNALVAATTLSPVMITRKSLMMFTAFEDASFAADLYPNHHES